MISNSQIKTIAFTLVAIALLTRVDATKELIIGRRSFF